MNHLRLAILIDALRNQTSGTDDANCSSNVADVCLKIRQGKQVDLSHVARELTNLFESLDVELNSAPSCEIPRKLAYAVNGLLILCMQAKGTATGGSDEKLEQLSEQIVTQWDSVLAGDIESISEGL